eukprot:gene3418-13463_t
MGWSDEVHETRKENTLQDERRKFKLRREGASTFELKNAGIGALGTVVLATSSYLIWNKFGDRLRNIEWRQLPVVKEFYTLVTGKQAPLVRPKSRPVPSAKATMHGTQASHCGDAQALAANAAATRADARARAAGAAERRAASKPGSTSTSSKAQAVPQAEVLSSFLPAHTEPGAQGGKKKNKNKGKKKK